MDWRALFDRSPRRNRVLHAVPLGYHKGMNTPDDSTKDKDSGSGRLSSVTSALHVLKVFSEDEPEIGISALAKRLGLAKSTVHRLAVTLASEGFLEQNPDNGRYRLGLSLFTLGTLVRRRMDVSTQGLPLLGQLRDQTQEAVHLAILDQTSIMYLYNLESSQAIGIRSYLGARKPAFCTSEGKVMLAFSAPEIVAKVIKEGLTARTPKTNTDPKALVQALEEARQGGYALDDEESEIGMRGIAAPIRDISGRVIAAVGLAGPIQRVTKKELRGYVPQVVSTADAISARLGYNPR
jgi:IclR family transcriptional regulator, KDG regulon repressor